MKISSSQIQSLLRAYGHEPIKDAEGRVNKVGTVKKAGALDQMMMSGQAQAFQVAKQAINGTPEVRSQVIDPLKEAVRTGTYSVADGDIAEKLIGRSIVDIIVE